MDIDKISVAKILNLESQEISLDYPIVRGETEITSITIRRPNAGALRGISLRGLLDIDVNEVIKVLPRISTPSLTDQEAVQLGAPDIVQVGFIIAGFLLPKSAQNAIEN